MTPGMFRRVMAATVIAGCLLAAVGGAIAPVKVGQTAAAAAPPAGVWGAAWDRAFSSGGGGLFGSCHGPYGTFGDRGVTLMVRSVNGTTISAATWDGSSVTVIVRESTRYREADRSASLSDLHMGSVIVVHGTRTGTNTIEATDVMVLLLRLAGVVTAVNGSTLTATGFDGVPHIITVHDQTRYERAGHVATLADVTVGTAIVAEGTPNGDGSFSAVAVMIQVPHVVGQVTAVNGSVITVSSPFGTTYTVITAAITTYTAPGNAPVSASAVQIGTLIGAEGTLSANRKTLSALRIMVLSGHPSCMPQHEG